MVQHLNHNCNVVNSLCVQSRDGVVGHVREQGLNQEANIMEQMNLDEPPQRTGNLQLCGLGGGLKGVDFEVQPPGRKNQGTVGYVWRSRRLTRSLGGHVRYK